MTRWKELPEISRIELSTRNDTSDSTTLFTRRDNAECGIEFSNLLKRENRQRYVENGSGLAVGDFDNDGLPDLFLCSLDGPNQLYRQVSPFKFENVTEKLGIDSSSDNWSTGATFVDIDNDGDLDLYVCRLDASNQLYINEDQFFFERGREFGLDFSGSSVMSSFADYDNDGDLDMYLVTTGVIQSEDIPASNILIAKKGRKIQVTAEHRDRYQYINGRIVDAGNRDLFFVNNGANGFVELSSQVGIGDHDAGHSAIWCDFNNDRWLDLYVANDGFSSDKLYLNNKDGTMSDVSRIFSGRTPWFSSGTDVSDVDGDGQFDLLVGDALSTAHSGRKSNLLDVQISDWFLEGSRPQQLLQNCLFLNSGNAPFVEIANLAGLNAGDRTWSVRFGDLDSDGFDDVFFTNGASRANSDIDSNMQSIRLRIEGMQVQLVDYLLSLSPQFEKNLAFQRSSGLRFEDKTDQWGLGLVGVSHGSILADLDRDGDLDVVVNNLNAPLAIYENNQTSHDNLLISLRGKRNNALGVGAKLTLKTDKHSQTRLLNPTRGYMSSNEPIVHFGLGGADSIEKLLIEWPDGNQQIISEGLTPNGHYVVVEPDQIEAGSKQSTEKVSDVKPLFAEASQQISLWFKHSEMPFDDFAREPLLPAKMSVLGPGLAVGDVNKDQKLDIVISGARGQSLSMMIQNDDGTYGESEGPWSQDFHHEDLMPLLFDFDGDSDLDLYVVSGSNEFALGNAKLQDRLYANDGQGNFIKTTEVLPEMLESGSCVAAADFDRDGDLDLFVGSRLSVGKFPSVPQSRLLRNDDGVFHEVTNEVAENLRNVGMVTSAIWTDANQDGWIDLLIATDWGTIHLFNNRFGTLSEDSEASNLSNLFGQWRGIASGDVDHDGDLDYVVSNIGLNTRMRASEEYPHFAHVMDGNRDGTFEIIETEWENGVEVPVRFRIEMAKAFDSVGDYFRSFDSFASASLEDFQSAMSLEDLQQIHLNHLEHVLLVNDGSGKFDVRPLPDMAQLSAGFGIELQDFNVDGHLDIFLGQNQFSNYVHFGKTNTGLSAILLGDGQGNFDYLSPTQSGIIIRGETRGLVSADINQDGLLDVLVSQNNNKLLCFLNQGTMEQRALSVSLSYQGGNRSAIGSTVIVVKKDGTKTAQEISAGCSYLSQHPAQLLFGLGKSEIEKIIVHWPDGESSEHLADSFAKELEKGFLTIQRK